VKGVKPVYQATNVYWAVFEDIDDPSKLARYLFRDGG
jgi:hypothetical protein